MTTPRKIIYNLPGNAPQADQTDNFPTPLEYTINEMGLDENKIISIPHRHVSTICSAIGHNGTNQMLEVPIDMTIATHNIVHDGIFLFHVQDIQVHHKSLLNGLVGKEIDLFLSIDETEIWACSKTTAICLRLAYEPLEHVSFQDYNIIRIEEYPVDESPDHEGVELITKSTLQGITMFYRRYYTTIPYSDGARGYDLITTQARVENAIQLTFKDSIFFLTAETFNATDNGRFRYIQDYSAAFDYIADNNLEIAGRLPFNLGHND